MAEIRTRHKIALQILIVLMAAIPAAGLSGCFRYTLTKEALDRIARVEEIRLRGDRAGLCAEVADDHNASALTRNYKVECLEDSFRNGSAEVQSPSGRSRAIWIYTEAATCGSQYAADSLSRMAAKVPENRFFEGKEGYLYLLAPDGKECGLTKSFTTTGAILAPLSIPMEIAISTTFLPALILLPVVTLSCLIGCGAISLPCLLFDSRCIDCNFCSFGNSH